MHVFTTKWADFCFLLFLKKEQKLFPVFSNFGSGITLNKPTLFIRMAQHSGNMESIVKDQNMCCSSVCVVAIVETRKS